HHHVHTDVRRRDPAAPHPTRPAPALPYPGGTAGMWVVAGVGFLAVTFAFVLAFVPPIQLPVGSPTSYVALVAAGTIVFTAIPLLIHHLRRPTWRPTRPTPTTGTLQTRREASKP